MKLFADHSDDSQRGSLRIQLTQEVVALVQAIEAAFTAGQTPATHQQAVASALGAHLAKA